MKPINNILVPIDFSGITDALIRASVSLGSVHSCHIWILHVADPEPVFVGYDEKPHASRHQTGAQLRAEHTQLQEITETARKRGIKATAIQAQGPTVDMIVREAEKLSADLIIMGYHGHSGLYRTIMGSVCEGTLKRSPCPVLVIPYGLTGSNLDE